MTINSSQKDVEVFCVPLVSHKVTIYEINDQSAKYVNLEKNLQIRRSRLSPSSGMVVWKERNFENSRDKMKYFKFFFSKLTYFAFGSLIP